MHHLSDICICHTDKAVFSMFGKFYWYYTSEGIFFECFVCMIAGVTGKKGKLQFTSVSKFFVLCLEVSEILLGGTFLAFVVDCYLRTQLLD